jgi:hypothetical protein
MPKAEQLTAAQGIKFNSVTETMQLAAAQSKFHRQNNQLQCQGDIVARATKVKQLRIPLSGGSF